MKILKILKIRNMLPRVMDYYNNNNIEYDKDSVINIFNTLKRKKYKNINIPATIVCDNMIHYIDSDKTSLYEVSVIMNDNIGDKYSIVLIPYSVLVNLDIKEDIVYVENLVTIIASIIYEILNYNMSENKILKYNIKMYGLFKTFKRYHGNIL